MPTPHVIIDRDIIIIDRRVTIAGRTTVGDLLLLSGGGGLLRLSSEMDENLREY